MSTQRYPEEFKTEAVKRVTERGHTVADESCRLGVREHSLYKWVDEARQPADVRHRQPKAELKRETEERDIPRIAAAYFAKQSG